MARIRTIKPELFRHEGLFELELESKLPIRFAWCGLFTVCDREGRFKWKPRQIKLDVLPYDDIDFSRVLDALVTRGFVVKYASSDGQEYGFIPSFLDHQVINNRESASKIPSFEDCEEIQGPTRVSHASPTRHDLAQGEGKGREGNMEGEREGKSAQTTRIKKPDSFKAFFSAYPPNKKGGTDATAWKKAKALGLTDDDFKQMLDDVQQRQLKDPSWYQTYAQGITKYLDERIWLTPIAEKPNAGMTKQQLFDAKIAERNAKLGIGGRQGDFIDGEVVGRE